MTRLLIASAALLVCASNVSAQQFADVRPKESTAAAALPAPLALSAAEHVEIARRALTTGEYRTARREFKVAALLEREDGRVPTEATLGLVSVLCLQGKLGDAAIELERLATEAAAQGDADTEARALADAIWLKVEAGGRQTVRNEAIRLRRLLDSSRLAPETREYVTQRVR